MFPKYLASQFDNFGDGEPNNSYNKEHCVEVKLDHRLYSH